MLCKFRQKTTYGNPYLTELAYLFCCDIVYSLFVIIEHFHKEPQPDEARHNERDPLLRSELNIVDD